MKIIGNSVRFRSENEARRICGALFRSGRGAPWSISRRDGRGAFVRVYAPSKGGTVPLMPGMLASA